MGVLRRWTWVPLILPLLLATSASGLDVEVGWRIVRMPFITTEMATDISSDGAVLNGYLEDIGGVEAVRVSFEWGRTPALGEEISADVLTEPGSFSATLTELEPNREYYFRAKAVGNGTAYGGTLTFRTASGPSVDDVFPQLWMYIVIAAVALLVSFFILRKSRVLGEKEERLIEKAFIINNKGQLLKELSLGTDGVDLGYRDLLKLLVGKGLIKVETVKSGKHYVHFLHRDGIHMACVSSSPAREKVLEKASRLFEDLKDELQA